MRRRERTRLMLLELALAVSSTTTVAMLALGGCSSSTNNADAANVDGGGDAGGIVADDAGEQTDAATDDASSEDAGPVAPPLPPLVPLLPNGRVLAALKLVTLTFSDDPNVDQDEAFGDWVVSSTWLASASEYGVGKGTHAKKVRLGVNAPKTAASIDIQKIIVDAMNAGTVPKPTADTDPFLYAVYFPSTTLLTTQDGTIHCQGFSGYHTEGSISGDGGSGGGSVHFAFAAVGDCPTYVSGLSELENIERTASHEILEAATDPLVTTAPAYYAGDDKLSPWSFVGGELGDVCPISGVIHDGAFLAQRFWSNAAANAGTNPCIPVSAGEYFIASATPSTTQTVAAGASTTFAIRGYSTAPDAKPWKIQAKALSASTLAATSTLDVATMTNGGTATLTVTVPANAPSKSSTIIALYSYRTTDSYSYWPIAITVP